MPSSMRLRPRQVIRLARIPVLILAALLLDYLRVMSVRSFAFLLIIVLVAAEAFIPDQADAPKPDQ